MILFLDTSSKKVKILLIFKENIFKSEFEAKEKLSKVIFLEIEKILKKACFKKENLKALAGFIGPGSFTGLRIGLAVLNGLSFALNVPLIEIKEKEIKDLKKLTKTILEKYKQKKFKEFLTPFYGQPPKITKQKRKN